MYYIKLSKNPHISLYSQPHFQLILNPHTKPIYNNSLDTFPFIPPSEHFNEAIKVKLVGFEHSSHFAFSTLIKCTNLQVFRT